MTHSKISAIIIINPDWFDDLQHLPKCLATLQWAGEKLLVTSRITDELKDIGKKYHAQVIKQQGDNFAAWRNFAISQAKGEWVLFVDSDERVTEELQKEIEGVLKKTVQSFVVSSERSESRNLRRSLHFGRNDKYAAYAIPRSNIILGREMRHGGWWPDYVLRLIKKDQLISWQGELHEQPQIKGEIGYLTSPLTHYKFQKLEDYMEKTNVWSNSEAELLMKAKHPRLNSLRFWRLTLHPFLTSFVNRYVVEKGFLDGTEGLIDAIYQSYSQFINFAKLWEKQLKTPEGSRLCP